MNPEGDAYLHDDLPEELRLLLEKRQEEERRAKEGRRDSNPPDFPGSDQRTGSTERRTGRRRSS